MQPLWVSIWNTPANKNNCFVRVEGGSLLRPHARWQKMHKSKTRISVTHLLTLFRSSSKWCSVVVSHWPSTWCEHQNQPRPAGSEEALVATLVDLGDVKKGHVGLSQNNRHPRVSKQKQRQIRTKRMWPTFHNHIKIVHNLSSWAFGCALVFPLVPLFYCRYDQQLSKLVICCPCRQLLSHFHPFHRRSGTTKWSNDMLCTDREEPKCVCAFSCDGKALIHTIPLAYTPDASPLLSPAPSLSEHQRAAAGWVFSPGGLSLCET